MRILRCGMLLSIFSYHLLAIAVAQNVCLYSSDTEGICRPFADCKELRDKVTFPNDACSEENTVCCPNNLITPPHSSNIDNYKTELNPNLENPPLPDEVRRKIWQDGEVDPNPPQVGNTKFTPDSAQTVGIPELTNQLPIWNLIPASEPELKLNPNINAPWDNGKPVNQPIIPGIQVNPGAPYSNDQLNKENPIDSLLNVQWLQEDPVVPIDFSGIQLNPLNPNINAPWDKDEPINPPLVVAAGVQVNPVDPHINDPWGNGQPIIPPIEFPGIELNPVDPHRNDLGNGMNPVDPHINSPVNKMKPIDTFVNAAPVKENSTLPPILPLEFQVKLRDPSKATAAIDSLTTSKPITTDTEAIPIFDEEFYRRLGLAFGNKYNKYHHQEVLTPRTDVETSTVSLIIEEVTTNTSSFISNLNQLGLHKLSLEKCGFVHLESDPSESNAKAHLLEFPWLALLRYEGGSRSPNFSCGGSLITERWVLTAASCIRKTLIGVRLGEYEISEKSNRDCLRKSCSIYKDFKITTAVKHADYKPETGVKDIALIKLKTRAQRNKNIKPICLPTKVEYFNVPYDNTPLTISGWGLNKEGTSKIMKKHAINRTKSQVCHQAYPEQRVQHSKLCLATSYEQPCTCSGDPGGPVIWVVDDNTKIFTQIGIVPFGMDKCGAADGVVSAYYVESVADSMDWITKVIGED